jgi:WD40 repeat protein
VAPLDGGPSRTLVEQVFGVWDWTSDGFVYFTEAPPSGVISRVPATGGGSEAVESLTELLEGELAHILFSVLPGGQMGVFQVLGQGGSTGEDLDVWAIDLETRERSFLTAGITPRYASTGHLLFATPGGVLMRQRIDPATAELTGPAVPVLEDLTVVGGVAAYAVSESGSLIYAAGEIEDATLDLTELVWVTRSGDATPVDPDWTFNPPPNNYGWSLSPDGSQVALTNVSDGNIDIWIKQLPDGPLERLTFDDADERYPVWTPDGQWVTYLRSESGRPTDLDAWRRRADGTGGPELLLDDERSLLQARWSPDGEWLVFRTAATAAEGLGLRDIVGFRPGVDTATMPLVATAEFVEEAPALSPDGRWLAYASDETGRAEVYVRPFPDVDSGKVRVSTDGGSGPLWAHSGSELFFVDVDQRLVAAEVQTDSAFRVVQRQTLFSVSREYRLLGNSDFYDIAPDDQRFLMGRVVGLRDDTIDDIRIILVINWFEELRERLGN